LPYEQLHCWDSSVLHPFDPWYTSVVSFHYLEQDLLVQRVLMSRLSQAAELYSAGLSVPRATMDKITFGSDLPGYEAGPKEGPAVVVLQEWWGKWLK
jgi:hypothetical protein